MLAKSFKWIYSKVCLCRICPGVAKRRIIRERRKLRQLARAVSVHRTSSRIFVVMLSISTQLQLHNMESARGSSSTSYSSTSKSSTNSSSSSGSSDYTKSSVQTSSVLDVPYSDSDSDIEREIRGSTDEITVPLTVCVFVMVR